MTTDIVQVWDRESENLMENSKHTISSTVSGTLQSVSPPISPPFPQSSSIFHGKSV